jgi:catechol 2,3-dioxygenase-like lactoylglutathione lyase family enzyme
MFNHVMVGALDIDESKCFYDAALGALGVAAGVKDSAERCSFRTPTGVFMIKLPIDGAPATFGNGSTVGFAANDTAQVDAWHAAGIANGGTTCEDPPGVRERGNFRVYLAYMRDPAGNKLCAAFRMP